MYKRSIQQLRSKINKISHIMSKLSPSIMIVKAFAILNGLRNVKRNNDGYDVMNDIQNNGLVMTKTVKTLLTENIFTDKFNNFSNDNNLNYFVPKINFIRKSANYCQTNLNNENNKLNCDKSVMYFYETIPKLEIYEQITILRTVVENTQNYPYLKDIDVHYLKKLLEFLERTYFGSV